MSVLSSKHPEFQYDDSRDLNSLIVALNEFKVNVANYLNNIYRKLEQVAVAVASNTISLDCESGGYFVVDVDANITTINISNPIEGQEIVIHFIQDATGGYTVSGWPSGTKHAWSDTGNTASKESTIILKYNTSAYWVQIGAQSPYM